MANLFAELISPERLVFSGEVKSVVLPGVEGDMTILPGHVPMMAMLNPGMIFATDAEGKSRRAFVMGAFAEITGDKVTILAERVLAVEEVTRERLDEEIVHLQMTRDATEDEVARAQAEVSISRLEELKGSLEI